MKKALVFLPILADAAHSKAIINSCQFLEKNYALRVIDPLFFVKEDTNLDNFIENWCQVITNMDYKEYSLMIGFSLGGILLLYLLNKLKFRVKTILFSAPSYCDTSLKNKLEKIKSMLVCGDFNEAILIKSYYVNYPNKTMDILDTNNLDIKHTTMKVKKGLEFVLSSDLRDIVKNFDLPYIHFYGEKSLLVSHKNVTRGIHANILEVPGAGMRTLQDNDKFVIDHINEYLET